MPAGIHDLDITFVHGTEVICTTSNTQQTSNCSSA